jgi:hypothetical protein
MATFIAYHNSEKMGYPASQLESPRILTNKSVRNLPGQTVWLISGEGQRQRSYYLAAVFEVDRTFMGSSAYAGFKNSAQGPGLLFGETICLDRLSWFEDLKKKLINFRNGLTELTDDLAVYELQRLVDHHVSHAK